MKESIQFPVYIQFTSDPDKNDGLSPSVVEFKEYLITKYPELEFMYLVGTEEAPYFVIHFNRES